MFNFHIGIPWIGHDLLHSVDKARILQPNTSPYILSQNVWRDQFRHLMNKESEHPILEAWGVADAKIADLLIREPVAISQHAILGSAQDWFLKRKTLPFAEYRISRILDIFAGVPLTFHLTITSQFDYIQTLMDRKILGGRETSLPAIPSWINLVQQIKNAAEGHKIVVWDFERPEKIALAFVAHLLETQDEALITRLRNHLSILIPSAGTLKKSHQLPSIPGETIDQIDVQYSLDLQSLSEMRGISLILHDTVPEKYHL